MLIFILKFSTCLAIFLVFYKLLLEKETIHNFKRFYLIAALLLSLIIPSITFIKYIEPDVILGSFRPAIETIATSKIEMVEEPVNYLPIMLWSIYGLGVFLFGLKFCVNLFNITYKIKRNPKHKSTIYTNVLLQDLITPHTFFNYIFLNKNKFETQQIPKEVLLHEEAHARQKHSLDIIFIEILQVLFWFNPLLYFSNKAIKLNHEFLADKAVLNQGIKPSTYQQILLAFSSNAAHPQLANAINYSLIKKRFTIMKSNTSRKAIWLRSLLMLPLLGGLLFSFSETKEVEKEITPLLSQVATQNKYTNGVTEVMMQEYRTFMKVFKTKNIIDGSKLDRIKAIYSLMSQAQKNTIEKYPETPSIDLRNVKPKKPTETQFESWKKEKVFALWIDGKHVQNSVLNKYTANDFVHYTGSLVHVNARKAPFYEPYQFNLYTEKGFKNAYRKTETQSALDKVREELKGINNIPVLDIKKQPLRFKLNGKTTTLETLNSDFKTIVGEKKTNLRINVKGGINMALINEINSKLKDYINKIKLSQGGYIIDTSFSNKNTVKTIPVVNGIKCDNCTLFLSKNSVEELILSTTSRKPITQFRIKFPGKPTESIKYNTTKGNAKVKSYLSSTPTGTKVQIFDIRTKDETLTPVIIELVDKSSPKYSNSPKVKKGELSDLPPPPPPAPAPVVVKKKGKRTLNEIIENTPKGLKTGYKMINGESHYHVTYKNGVTVYYNKLGQAVNKKGELLPPPPPPPPAPKKEMKTGSIDINNQKHYYTTINGKTRYFNRYGVETDKKGKKLVLNKQVNASDVIPDVNISRVYFNDKVVSEFKSNEYSVTESIPEAPSMLQLTNKGAVFYYEGKKITGKKAIDLVDNNKDLNILIRDIDSKTPIVKLSKQPIRV